MFSYTDWCNFVEEFEGFVYKEDKSNRGNWQLTQAEEDYQQEVSVT